MSLQESMTAAISRVNAQIGMRGRAVFIKDQAEYEKALRECHALEELSCLCEPVNPEWIADMRRGTCC